MITLRRPTGGTTRKMMGSQSHLRKPYGTPRIHWQISNRRLLHSSLRPILSLTTCLYSTIRTCCCFVHWTLLFREGRRTSNWRLLHLRPTSILLTFLHSTSRPCCCFVYISRLQSIPLTRCYQMKEGCVIRPTFSFSLWRSPLYLSSPVLSLWHNHSTA
jgi:hypothetical protein